MMLLCSRQDILDLFVYKEKSSISRPSNFAGKRYGNEYRQSYSEVLLVFCNKKIELDDKIFSLGDLFWLVFFLAFV